MGSQFGPFVVQVCSINATWDLSLPSRPDRESPDVVKGSLLLLREPHVNLPFAVSMSEGLIRPCSGAGCHGTTS